MSSTFNADDVFGTAEKDLAIAMEKELIARSHLSSTLDLFGPESGTWGEIMETAINDALSKASEADLNFRVCQETYELQKMVDEIDAECARRDAAANDTAIAAAMDGWV